MQPGANRLNHVITTFARMRYGMSFRQSQAEMDTVFTRLAADHQEIKDWGIRLVTFEQSFVTPTIRTALLVLMGLVTFVLLIACANVANLMLSRGAARQREVAIRSSLGASRGLLIRQFLIESILLAFGGGVAGVAGAYSGIRVLNGVLPAGLLPVPDVRLDTPVLFFALFATVITGLLFGITPALFAARGDPGVLMRAGGRGATGGAPMVRNGLVAIELILATCLLICAGLLLQSLQKLQRVPLGFPPDKLLTFQLSPPKSSYPNVAAAWVLYDKMLKALNSTPGIQSAALCSGIPFGVGNYTRTPIAAPGDSALPPGQSTPVDWRSVSPGYFRTMSIPLLKGRDFTDQDGAGAPFVAVVSQEAARTMWGIRDPIGRIAHVVGSGRDYTIIGVVGGVRNAALNQQPIPGIYYYATNGMWPTMDVVVHTQGVPESVLPVVREVMRKIDPTLPMGNVRTMDQWLQTTAAQPKLNASLVTGFAVVALLISAIGIYGVLSYAVTQRTREIGVRMALGARRSEVIRLVLRNGMSVALVGIAVGVAGAFAFGKVMESLVFEIQVRDPKTYTVAALVLTAAAALACYVPARRASRVDPIVALRED
jgi:putative ABC transport system permease protein